MIAVVLLMIVGLMGEAACRAEVDLDTPAAVRIERRSVRLVELLRIKEYGRAEDELDGILAEAIANLQQEPERVYLGLFWVTGYDLCVQCCGIWSAEHPSRQGTDYVQTTASGVPNCVGVTIAAGPEFGFGTVLYIEGVGERTVQDRGVGNGCIDVLCHDHAGCAKVTGWREVWLIYQP